MRLSSVLLALACSATLAGCVRPDRPTPEVRVTLPEPPSGLEACFRKAFPEIPDRELTTRDVVRIVGGAKVLDRAKSACGRRAASWIDAVRRDLGRQP